MAPSLRPAALPPPSRNPTDALASLRQTIARMEGRPATEAAVPVLRFGCPEIDGQLPGGGIAPGSVNDIVPIGYDATPAALGFALALLAATQGAAALVQTKRLEAELGQPYGPGLQDAGIDPARLLIVSAESAADAQWAIEECLTAEALSFVIGLLGAPLSPTVGRRFSLAAQNAGHPLVLLHPHDTAGSNTADTRWLIGAAPAARDRFGALSQPRWSVTLQRNRNGRTGQWILESGHGPHRFRVVETLADRALPASADARRPHSVHR